MKNKYCDKCGTQIMFQCYNSPGEYLQEPCDCIAPDSWINDPPTRGNAYTPDLRCWPFEKTITWVNKRTVTVPLRKPIDIYYPTHNIIIPGIHEMTIPQLLDQAEQVRNARREKINWDYWQWVQHWNNDKRILSRPPENPKGDCDGR